MTSIGELRRKSISLTNYLESLLLHCPVAGSTEDRPFIVITPDHQDERGAQLSVRLKPGLLDHVLKELDSNGVIVDERKPDVVRIAPAPIYNTFVDVWSFVQIFLQACQEAKKREGI